MHRTMLVGPLCALALAGSTLAGPAHGTAPSVSTDANTYSGEPLTADRLAGLDRYGTAARISETWAPGVDNVYVVSGSSYADALSASARAGSQDAPVLLVRLDGVPSETAAALERLTPQRVTVVGGEAAISSTVVEKLRAHAGSGGVVRISGVDRYETTTAVSATYEPGAARVLLASGENFPDALAGAALAAHEGIPLLLTRRSHIPAAVASELSRLNPSTVTVLGGTTVISDRVADQAAALSSSGTSERLAGSTRYGTAAAIAKEFGQEGATTFVASGSEFPDALAGAALAGSTGGPLLLNPAERVANQTADALQQQLPESLVVLGGNQVISEATADELSAAAQPGFLEGWGMPAYSDEFTYIDPATEEPALDPGKWNMRPRSDLGLTFDAAETRNEQLVVDDGVLHILGEWMDEPKPSGRSNGIQWLTHWTGYVDHRPLREGDFAYEQQYGRWEIRAKVPSGPKTYGSLAAFWLRNQQSGEVDIMEAWGYNEAAAPGGQRIDTATTTVHTHTSDPDKNDRYIWHHEDFGADTPVWDDFHTYAFELTPTYAAVFFDGAEILRVTPETHPNLWDPEYFGSPLHVRLNLHIGPSPTYWGLPDPENRGWTQDPLDFAVDYVRIYEYEP